MRPNRADLYRYWLVLWPAAVLWAVLLGFAAVKDVHIPDGRGFDMLAVSLLVTAQFLIVSTALRLMHGLDGFTVALSAFLSVKTLYWLWVMASWLWPAYVLAHRELLTALRFGIVLSAVWLLLAMVRVSGIVHEQERVAENRTG